MIWLLALAAQAGNLYVNNTLVDPRSLPNVALDKVNVRFDAQGNIFVDAPGYKIQVQGGVTAAPMPMPAMPVPGGMTTAPPPASGVSPARWWMVTEDNGSSGHQVEVWVNGQLAQTVTSGQPQKIVDVGRWLRVGANQVLVKSSSTNPTGGSFYVYLGTGSDQSGTVVMDNPAVSFGVGSSRSGPYQREYTLNVDR
jgi:hypothetical protein